MSALATELRALADLHRAREDGAVLQHMHSMRAVYRMREKDIELAMIYLGEEDPCGPSETVNYRMMRSLRAGLQHLAGRASA